MKRKMDFRLDDPLVRGTSFKNTVVLVLEAFRSIVRLKRMKNYEIPDDRVYAIETTNFSQKGRSTSRNRPSIKFNRK